MRELAVSYRTLDPNSLFHIFFNPEPILRNSLVLAQLFECNLNTSQLISYLLAAAAGYNADFGAPI